MNDVKGFVVVEGVMVRHGDDVSLAVQDGGNVVVESTSWDSFDVSWRNKPFLRGIFELAEILVNTVRMLSWSAKIAENLRRRRCGVEGWSVTRPPVGWSLLGLIGLLFILFMAMPQLLVYTIGHAYGIAALMNGSSFAYLALESFIKVFAFVGIVWAIGKHPEGARAYSYLGALNMTLNAKDAGYPITEPYVSGRSRIHSRCSVTFVFTAILLSSILFAPILWLLGIQSAIAVMILRLLFFPIFAGLAYEFLNYARHGWMNRPIYAIQYLTTSTPTLYQVSVAIAAIQHMEKIKNEG